MPTPPRHSSARRFGIVVTLGLVGAGAYLAREQGWLNSIPGLAGFHPVKLSASLERFDESVPDPFDSDEVGPHWNETLAQDAPEETPDQTDAGAGVSPVQPTI